MFIDHEMDMLPHWLQWLLATPVQFWVGRRFYIGGWAFPRGGNANMDVLIALGTSMAYFFSTAQSQYLDWINMFILKPAQP